MSAGDMPDELEDLDESAGEDLKKAHQTVKKYRNRDSSMEAAIPGLIEALLWAVALAAGAVFLGGMFVTGPDGLLTGTEWLVIGAGGLIVWGGTAYLFRVLKP